METRLDRRTFSRALLEQIPSWSNLCLRLPHGIYKLKNPRLLNISFKTLRHFRGTMEAWRTRDPFHIQQFLRHKNIKNTMRYIHLAQVLFKNEQECITKVAHNVNEPCALIEDGWKYCTGEYADSGARARSSQNPKIPWRPSSKR